MSIGHSHRQSSKSILICIRFVVGPNNLLIITVTKNKVCQNSDAPLFFSSIHFTLPEFLHHLIGGVSINHTARFGAFVLYVNMTLSFIICGYNRLSRLIRQKLVTFCDQNIYYCSFLFPKATRYQLESFSKETRRILFYSEIAK